MKILAFERELPGAAKELFTLHGKSEARAVWELTQAGVIRELYFHADQHAAVLVWECASVEEAAAVLSGLPYALQGLITFNLVPLVPYSGFARLFAAE